VNFIADHNDQDLLELVINDHVVCHQQLSSIPGLRNCSGTWNKAIL
jgi:hypothetical protein